MIRSYGGWQEIIKKRKNHEARIGDERILGDSDFVQQVIESDEINLEEALLLKRNGWNIDKLAETVSRQYFDIEPTQLPMKGRNNSISHANALICYWGNIRLGISSTELGARLHISQSSVSRAVKRGEEYSKNNSIEFK